IRDGFRGRRTAARKSAALPDAQLRDRPRRPVPVAVGAAVRIHRLLSLGILAASLSLAAVAHAQVLYWIDTNYAAPTLNQSDAVGNLQASVPLVAASQPEGLAVDATGKLYFAEGAWSGARVLRAAPTLAGITPLVTGGSAFRGIA